MRSPVQTALALESSPKSGHFEVDRWGMLLTGYERYFMSGCNRVSEIRACFEARQHVGVAASKLRPSGEAELIRCLGEDVLGNRESACWRVFFDSGAFSKKTSADGQEVLHRIPGAQWRKRLAMYARVVRAGGRRVHVVVPDVVGDWPATLRLLVLFRKTISRLARWGARLIIPLQRDGRGLHQQRLEIMALLGCPEEQLIWGLPFRAEYSTDELRAFAAALHGEAQLAVHLLGTGPKSKAYRPLKQVFSSVAPNVTVWCDSVRLCALVGNTNGPGGQPRPLTAARRQVLAELGEAADVTEVHRRAMHQVLSREHAMAVEQAREAGWHDEGEEEEVMSEALV